MTQPIYDFTGRGEGSNESNNRRRMNREDSRSMAALGPIDPYNNEYVMQRQRANTEALYEALGMIFPVHPALGGQLQEIGNMIIDVASGSTTTTAKDRELFSGEYDPSGMDRMGGLIGTWTGNALEDIGQALGLRNQDLARVARSFKQLQNNPDVQSAFLSHLGQTLKSRYGGDEGPLQAAEDFGSMGAFMPAGKATSLLAKLAGKAEGVTTKYAKPVTAISKQSIIPLGEPPASDAFPKFRPGKNPLMTPSDKQVITEQDIGVRQSMPLGNWDPPADSAEFKEFLEVDEIEGESFEFKPSAKVDPDVKPKDKPDVETVDFDLDKPIDQMTDDELDQAIRDLNKALNSKLDKNTTEQYNMSLEELIIERRKRRKDKGSGSSSIG